MNTDNHYIPKLLDRSKITAMTTLKVIKKIGFRIEK